MTATPPRSDIYDSDISFTQLAADSPAFASFLKPNGQLDFSDPAAVQQLTTSLLERDFGLKVKLPVDRLCPPLPNRLSYVGWIQRLVDTTQHLVDENGRFTYGHDEYDPEREVVGLDIGTGASAIYPLLGCSLRPEWRFAATDIDEKNINFARMNIKQNNFGTRVRIFHSSTAGPLLPLDTFKLSRIDFVICNPPFYSSSADLLASAAAKSRPPHSACTGAEVEMVTDGGEVAFVTRLVRESQNFKDRVQWFSSLLGKRSSVEDIVKAVNEVEATNWAVKTFTHAGKTRRWAVAWSWKGERPSVDVARSGDLPKNLLPFPAEYSFLVSARRRDIVGQQAGAELAEIEVPWQYDSERHAGVGVASQNTWGRAARRERQRARNRGELGPRSSDGPGASGALDRAFKMGEPLLAFTLTFIDAPETPGSTVVVVRWLFGHSHVPFESFCSAIRNALTAGLGREDGATEVADVRSIA